ncbi:MAG: hypothetical protein DCF22_11965 [Leptolyngbya sp.]|nr:MAG: hypothetical protein DCF22_11965 [Leptolyngbya sp.]
MNSLPELKAKLATLETQVAAIRGSGECLQGVRLEKAAAGGSASSKSQSDYKYGRLRCGKGNLLPNGQKSQYVPLAELGNVEAAIARGKELTKFQREICKVTAQIDRIVATAASLGLPV